MSKTLRNGNTKNLYHKKNKTKNLSSHNVFSVCKRLLVSGLLVCLFHSILSMTLRNDSLKMSIEAKYAWSYKQSGHRKTCRCRYCYTYTNTDDLTKNILFFYYANDVICMQFVNTEAEECKREWHYRYYVSLFQLSITF